jgi:hypothetical protein
MKLAESAENFQVMLNGFAESDAGIDYDPVAVEAGSSSLVQSPG